MEYRPPVVPADSTSLCHASRDSVDHTQLTRSGPFKQQGLGITWVDLTFVWNAGDLLSQIEHRNDGLDADRGMRSARPVDSAGELSF